MSRSGGGVLDPKRAPAGLILAAGRGTRMRSARPKVLHEVAGRPLLRWVVELAREVGLSPIGVVVNPQERPLIERAFPEEGLVWFEQAEARGTGDAVLRARAFLEVGGPVAILSGDAPLLLPSTLRRLLEAASGRFGSFAVAQLEDPGNLGRVVLRERQRLVRIVEARDATREELAISWVNAGFYVVDGAGLLPYLEMLRPDNAQGELYLTDALSLAASQGHELVAVPVEEGSESWGVNNRRELARAHRCLLGRYLDALLEQGVTVLEPEEVVVEPGVEVGADTVLHRGVHLLGKTRIGPGVVVHAGCWIRDSEVGAGTVVEPYSVLDGARVGPACQIGPFARLRPGTVLETEVRVGNFVETKEAHLGCGVRVLHLSYLGDAEVGDGANIGAGTITCNFDGVAKHRTHIGPEAFVGSDTMLVAPVTIGRGATTGAGSVITQDVPEGALAVERSPQRVVPGWRERRRSRKGE